MKLLEEDEIGELCHALNLPIDVVRTACPDEGVVGEIEQFTFIGWMLAQERRVGGHGIDVSLLSRDQAKATRIPYSAMAYSTDGSPAIDTVMSARGPAVSVALAIIAAWQTH